MGIQVGRDSGENQINGMRRDGRDGFGRDRVAVEHPRIRHTVRSIPQGVRDHQQGSVAPVHRSREA